MESPFYEMSQEFFDDANRQFKNGYARGFSDALLKAKKPTSHWVFGNSYGHAWMKCSNCCVSQSGQTACWSYCPNCGARMEGQVVWEVSQIDMQMPDSCSECRFETKRGFCNAMPDNFCGYTNDERRPEWCLLREQKPVKPITRPEPFRATVRFDFDCVCGTPLLKGQPHCAFCGKEVNWE